MAKVSDLTAFSPVRFDVLFGVEAYTHSIGWSGWNDWAGVSIMDASAAAAAAIQAKRALIENASSRLDHASTRVGRGAGQKTVAPRWEGGKCKYQPTLQDTTPQDTAAAQRSSTVHFISLCPPGVINLFIPIEES